MIDELVIYCDGGSRPNPGPGAYGLVVYDKIGISYTLIHQIGKYLGKTTNNIAEYKGLIAALDYIKYSKIRCSCINSDSRLVVEQINGNWKVKDKDLKLQHARAKELLNDIKEENCFVNIKWIPREYNSVADSLSTKAILEQKDVEL